MSPGPYGLPLRSAVIARRRWALRLLVGSVALAFVGLVGTAAWTVWRDVTTEVQTIASTTRPELVAASAPVKGDTRPVYKHSIVAGGAYSRHEVAAVVRRDPVAAAHYSAIDVERVRPTTVKAARAAYVSYRVGDKTYWTRNPVRLAAGETLLTDGTSEIRARCGNLVSDYARQPVAAVEPPLASLDETIPEGDSSSMSEARDESPIPSEVPFLSTWSGELAQPQAALDATGASFAADGYGPMFFGPSGVVGPAGADGTGHVAPLGSGERPNGGSNGNGPNGGGPNGGGPKGDGPEGGRPGGGGPKGDDTHEIVDPGTESTTGVPHETTGSGDDEDVPSVPEPATLTLIGLGICGAAWRAWHGRR